MYGVSGAMVKSSLYWVVILVSSGYVGYEYWEKYRFVVARFGYFGNIPRVFGSGGHLLWVYWVVRFGSR